MGKSPTRLILIFDIWDDDRFPILIWENNINGNQSPPTRSLNPQKTSVDSGAIPMTGTFPGPRMSQGPKDLLELGRGHHLHCLGPGGQVGILADDRLKIMECGPPNDSSVDF